MIGIIGLGNVLMGDDGIGIEIVEQLRKNYEFYPEIELIDGGTSSFSLPFYKFKKLIIVDVVVDEKRRPGDIVVYTKEDVISGVIKHKFSLHDTSLEEIFILLNLRDELPEEIQIVGVVPLIIKKFHIGLSDMLNQKRPMVVQKVINILKSWGIEAKLKY